MPHANFACGSTWRKPRGEGRKKEVLVCTALLLVTVTWEFDRTFLSLFVSFPWVDPIAFFPIDVRGRSPLSSIVCFWFDSREGRFHVWGASHTWHKPPWVGPTRCQSWNERGEVTNERRELKRKEDSNEWKERVETKGTAERKGRVETKGRKYIRNERKELQRTDERIKVTNRLWEAQEVKRRGFINEVKRKDGRNEMNDLTANGRKELKRKEGSN